MRHDELEGSGTYRHGDIDNAVNELTDGGKFKLDTAQWDDLVVLADSVKLPTSSAAQYFAWKTNLYTLRFGAAGGEYAHFTVQLPHSYVAGTDIKWHVHFAPAAADMTDGQTTIFQLTYSAIPVGAVTPDTTTTSSTYTSVGTTAIDKHCVAVGGSISGASFGSSTILVCRIERLAADTFGQSVIFLGTDFHYQKNRLGSTSEWSG